MQTIDIETTWDILRKIVPTIKAFQHWTFSLREPDEGGLALVILVKGTNNYKQEEYFPVNHFHPVPIATYNETAWRQFVHECCMRTMQHEMGEVLQFDGVRPFAPMHGPGEDPYARYFVRSVEDALTTQSGKKREGPV